MTAIDCKRCEEMLLDYLYGELAGAAARSVALHLEGCEVCARREREWRHAMKALDTLRDEAVPAASVESARQALERELLLAGAPRARAPRHIVRYVFAAAAVVLAAFGIYYLASPGGPGAGGGGILGTPAYAAEVEHKSYTLTVFNEDLALVRDERRIVNLQRGANLVRFTDVAAMIDPTSVRFESATDPLTTKVLEQNYEFDLATPGALLKKYIDKKIACVTKDGQIVEGFLASYEAGAGTDLSEIEKRAAKQGYFVDHFEESGQVMAVRRGAAPLEYIRTPAAAGSIVLTTDSGKGATTIVSLDDLTAIRLPEIPKGLLVKPTLVWNVRTEKPGAHDTTLIYQTRGFSWNADYVVTVGKDDVLDWSGWVTINNNSGTSYPDAKLKLIAGEVHRVQDFQGRIKFDDFTNGNAAQGADTILRGKAFEEKAFFEYHLYTLSAPTTLNNQQTKQLKLMKADGVKSTRHYIFDANVNDSRALVELDVWNKKENQLGMPLPKGNIRFRQADPDGDLEYVGSDSIEHTPKDEKLTLNIGAAFDVVGERVLRSQSSAGRTSTQSFVITVRNHKGAPVKVIVREHPSGGQWAVTVKSMEFNKIDQGAIEFPVDVPANGQATVSYTIRYDYGPARYVPVN